MKIENNITKQKKIVSKITLRVAAMVTIIHLLIGLSLVSTLTVSAQREGRTDRGEQSKGVYTTNNPHIVSVTGLQETTPGVARILPHQEFTINGQNFTRLKSNIKIFVLKQVFDAGISRSQDPKVGRRERFDVVATVIPTSAWNNGLKATLTGSLPVGPYFLQVEVAGVGKGNMKRIEIPRLKIGSETLKRKLAISISAKSAKPGEKVEVRGNFRDEYKYHIWFYFQADPKYRYPLIITKQGDGFLVGSLSEHSKPGVYDVHVGGTDLRRESPTFGTQERSNTVNFTVEAVSTDYKHLFEIEFRGIECFKESADGPGSDEIYMAGFVYRDANRSGYTPHWSAVFDRVDAGEKRIVPREFLTFGLTAEDVDYDPKKRRYGLDEYVMVVALGEYDGDGRWDGTAKPSSTVAKDAAYVLHGGGSRNQMVEKVKQSLRTTIDNASDGFPEDDCLGVEELTFTQAEMQKAIYFNGQPLEKSLHFRGDDSHYRAIFHLKLVKPIKK